MSSLSWLPSVYHSCQLQEHRRNKPFTQNPSILQAHNLPLALNEPGHLRGKEVSLWLRLYYPNEYRHTPTLSS